MKVQELIGKLQKLPGGALVIYSIDEEGNAYYPVMFTPTLGYYNEGIEEFYEKDSMKGKIPVKTVNAVCIN